MAGWVRRSSAKQSSSAGSCVTRVELASLPIERNGNKMYVAGRDDLIGINIKDGSKRAAFLLLPINVIPYPETPETPVIL
jgi:hypothetical protein